MKKLKMLFLFVLLFSLGFMAFRSTVPGKACYANCLFSSCESNEVGATCSCSWGMASCDGSFSINQTQELELKSLAEFLKGKGNNLGPEIIKNLEKLANYSRNTSSKFNKNFVDVSDEIAQLQRKLKSQIQKLDQETQIEISSWVYTREGSKDFDKVIKRNN